MPRCSEPINLREGTVEDLSAVYSLSRACFDEYWSLQSLYSALEGDYDLLLCEREGMLTGYILSLAVVDEIQIMQVAVAPASRRLGLARRMSRYLLEHAAGIRSISLEVRLSNEPARRLYAGLGFTQSGYRKQYYAANATGICEDAVLMAVQLPAN